MFLKGENKYFYEDLKKESLPPSLLYDNLFTLAARWQVPVVFVAG